MKERVDIAVDEDEKRIILGRGVEQWPKAKQRTSESTTVNMERLQLPRKQHATTGSVPKRALRLRKGRMVDLQQGRKWWKVQRPHEMADWKVTYKGISVRVSMRNREIILSGYRNHQSVIFSEYVASHLEKSCIPKSADTLPSTRQPVGSNCQYLSQYTAIL